MTRVRDTSRMRLAIGTIAWATTFSWGAMAIAQSSGANAQIEIGEAGGATTVSTAPVGPVVTIGEPEPPGTRHEPEPSTQTVYVRPAPLGASAYVPYVDRDPVRVRPVITPIERDRRRFRRMAIGGAVLVGVTTLMTAIGAFIALGMRPSGIDLAQAWVSFVPVIGPGAAGVLEIAQATPGGGLLAAFLIIDSLGQAAGLTMLVRGAMEPAPQATQPRRDVVRWQVTPWLGGASGITFSATF